MFTCKLIGLPACCLVMVLALQNCAVVAQDAPATGSAEPSNARDARKPTADARSDATEVKSATPFAEAMELYRAGNTGGASAKFTQVAQSGGEDGAAAYAWLARMQIQMNKPDEAELSAKKALELNPTLPTAQSAMGEVYYRQGKLLDAQELFRKIVLADKKDSRAYLGLAKIYWATANNLSAKQMIDHAHNLDAQDPDIFWHWLRTVATEDRAAALKAQLTLRTSEGGKPSAGLARSLTLQESPEKKSESSCKLTSKSISTEVNLESLHRDPKHLSGYGLPVHLNGTSSVLLVDTGASGILVDTRVAQKAGLKKIADTRTGGFGDKGAARGYAAFAEKITIGDLAFENCYVSVVETSRSLDEDGLIGADIFEDFLVDLDFPGKKLKLSPLPPVPDSSPQPFSLHARMPVDSELHNRYIPEGYANFQKFYRFGHDLLLPTHVNDSSAKLFLLDTGSWDNLISPAAAREASSLYSTGTMKVKGLSGEVKDVYKTEDITLTFGRFQQHRRDLIALDLQRFSSDAGTEVSGVLGFAMLWILEIKIDYRDHLVDFQVDESRLH